MKRLQSMVAIMVAAVAVVSFGWVSPAVADVGEGYVLGKGDFTNDWDDEGPVSVNSNSRGQAAGLWQYILWADGYNVDKDCIFGSGTASATRSWQSARGLAADGVAGNNSWAKAGNKLKNGSEVNLFIYDGTAHNLKLGRDPNNGRWINGETLTFVSYGDFSHCHGY